MTGDAGALELGLLLARARVGRDAAGARIAALAAGCDADRVTALLDHRRVLAVLGDRLPGVLGAEPAVRHARTASGAAALRLQDHGDTLVAALAAAGIRALPLKGPWLSERAHGDPGLRVSGDVDLLVARADLRAAVALLRGRGYAAPSDPVGPSGLPLLHHRLRHATHATVELHWRVHWHEERFSADLLASSDPADDLAALLLFYARDGFRGLRLLADVTAWCDRHEPASGALDGHLRRYPRLAPAWRAAAAAAQRLGAVVPLATGPLTRREELAVRLASWSERGSPDQLAANVALVDALLGPPGAMLRRQLATGDRPLRHLAKSVPRWAYALARVQRGPWDPPPG